MRDLSLYTLSNATYDASLLLALQEEQSNPSVAAQLYVSVVSCAAIRYEKEHDVVKAIDIMLAAIEVADYMREQLREPEPTQAFGQADHPTHGEDCERSTIPT